MTHLIAVPAPLQASSPEAVRRRFTAAELAAAGARSDRNELVDPSAPLIVRYRDRRGYSPAIQRIDAAIAARAPRRAALGWPGWTRRRRHRPRPGRPQSRS